MPQIIRARTNRLKKVTVIPSSSAKPTVDKVREYFTRSNTVINKQGIVINKNVSVKELPIRSSYRHKIV